MLCKYLHFTNTGIQVILTSLSSWNYKSLTSPGMNQLTNLVPSFLPTSINISLSFLPPPHILPHPSLPASYFLPSFILCQLPSCFLSCLLSLLPSLPPWPPSLYPSPFIPFPWSTHPFFPLHPHILLSLPPSLTLAMTLCASWYSPEASDMNSSDRYLVGASPERLLGSSTKQP